MSIKENISGRLANFITNGAFGRAMESAEIGQTGQSYFRERFWELEAALSRQDADPNSPGWVPMGETLGATHEFSRRGLRLMHRLALVMFLKNPLIRRGVKIQSQYVFGQGVSIDIEDDTAKEAWNDFWDDEANRRDWTSGTRLAALERKLQIKGNLFALFFVDRMSGGVQIREIDVDEIEEVVPDPDDGSRPAYYKRVYNKLVFNPTSGETEAVLTTEYHPDWHYNPSERKKLRSIAGNRVFWDRPMAHFARERMTKVGIAPSEIYAQLDWARGYSEFLSNRATVAKALSRIVMKFSSATRAGVQKAAQKLKTTFAGAGATGGDDVGGSTFTRDGNSVEAMNVKGATIHPDEGRRLLLMVCAGFGFGETFFGDVSVGTLATATSLDRPTELAMMECQAFWKEVLEAMARFVLLQATRAPLHPLSHKAKVAQKNRVESAQIGGKNITLNVEMPPLLAHDAFTQCQALDIAAAFVPLKKLMAKHFLNAIGEDDVDEALALLPDDEKIEEWPAPPTPAPLVPGVKQPDPATDPGAAPKPKAAPGKKKVTPPKLKPALAK